MIRESQKDVDLEASFRSNADSALNDRESWAGESVLQQSQPDTVSNKDMDDDMNSEHNKSSRRNDQLGKYGVEELLSTRFEDQDKESPQELRQGLQLCSEKLQQLELKLK